MQQPFSAEWKKKHSKVTWKVVACWALLHSGAWGLLPSRSFGGGDMWPVVDGGAGVLLLLIHDPVQLCWRRAGSRAPLQLGCPEQLTPNKTGDCLPETQDAQERGDTKLWQVCSWSSTSSRHLRESRNGIRQRSGQAGVLGCSFPGQPW